MKTNLFLSILLCVVISFSACKNVDELSPSGGKGTLTISTSESAKTKSTKEAGTSYELSDLATVIITIEKDGAAVKDYDKKELQLENWGDNSFTISGIELEEGANYSITSFELKNEDKATTFASPVNGSQAANWVQKALPITFDISADENTPVDVQVVTTLGSMPSDFGYNTFTFTDQTPAVQAYLENFEKIFVGQNSKVVHHFTQRGIPTYSEVYRNHAVNKKIITNFVAGTYKHYYTDDDTPVEKIDMESYSSSSIPLTTYEITEHHASGNIKKIENESYIEEFDDNGHRIKNTSINRAGKAGLVTEYSYDNNGYVNEIKYFDENNELLGSETYTFDENGNQLTKSTEQGLSSESSYNADNNVIETITYTYVNNSEDGNELVQKKYSTRKFEYNSNGTLSKISENRHHDTGDDIYYMKYNYNGDLLVSSKREGSFSADEYITYYDERGLQKDESGTMEFDYKGRLNKCIYPLANNRTKVEYYDLKEELMGTKIYDENDNLLYNVNSNYLRQYWDNGNTKYVVRFYNPEYIDEYLDAEIEVVHPTTESQFALIGNSIILDQHKYDEQGTRTSYTQYIPTRLPQNGEYIATAFERRFDETGIVQKEYYASTFYYHNEADAIPYKYIVTKYDNVNSIQTTTTYDSEGNIISQS
ncbi:MAG: hypothetical protein ACK5IQ_06410 [Bacteroidales bacterium]